MYKAYLHRKIDIETKEDTLTASFFGLLFYYPKDLVRRFFEKILEEHDLGDIIYYEFWPHWSAEKTDNENYVEPDLFIRFENLDLIIEVKNPGISITEAQIKKELKAYENEYNSDNKKLLAVAENCICNENNCISKTWREIAFIYYDTFYKTSFDNFVYADLTDDILTLLSWHGITFEFPQWENLVNIKIDYENSVKIFQALSEIYEQ